MALTSSPPRFARSPHLVDLVADAERLAALVAAAEPDARAALARVRRDDAARASLVLDGAVADLLPAVDEAERIAREVAAPDASLAAPGAPPERRGTWLDALRALDDAEDTTLRALELVGVVAGLTADDLAEPLLADPLPALGELHRRLTRGLVATSRAGQHRRSEQAVHDASTGRIIFLPVPPDAVAGELALLGAWLATTGAREHGLVASGIVHLELLRIHPYDAANGRLARAAARLVLRARGLDPNGLAAPEPGLAAHRLDYHEEVARTLRRRDHTIWLERWGEAVVDGLRRAARDLGVLDPQVPERARRFVEQRDEPDFTLADYRAEAAATPQDARADLSALLDAGRIVRRPGSRGLRFQRC